MGSIITNYGDEEDVDTARLYAAACQTCLFLQSNYQILRHQKFNLLDNSIRWTGDQQLLIIRDRLNDKMFLNSDRFQDACVDSEAREIHRKLVSVIDNKTGSSVDEDLANTFDEDQSNKKRVTFQVD